MARTATTTQKKKTTMPGIAYPATVLALVATARQLPPSAAFIRRRVLSAAMWLDEHEGLLRGCANGALRRVSDLRRDLC